MHDASTTRLNIGGSMFSFEQIAPRRGVPCPHLSHQVVELLDRFLTHRGETRRVGSAHHQDMPLHERPKRWKHNEAIR